MPNRMGGIDYKGKKWKTSSIVENDVRVLSTKEIAAISSKFRLKSGLSKEQFVVSSFGYPTMPKPEVRKGYGQVRIAPKNVSKPYFGHPIYWIDPEITEQRKDERNQEWLIRMFYLIDGLGYWHENGAFVDFLDVQDFSFSDAQIETYHNISELNAETNNFSLLDETDLRGVTLEEINEKTKDAVAKCMAIERNENIKMLQEQGYQYEFAKNILGSNVRDWSSAATDSGGYWSERILPPLAKIAATYDYRAQNNDTIISDLLKETKEIVSNIEDVIMKMNTASSILSLPVQSAVKGVSSARISLMSTMLSIANSENNMRKTKFAKIESAIDEALRDHGNTGVKGYDIVVHTIEEIYKEAWNSLKFNFINFDNYRNHEPIYATLMEMNSSLQRIAMSDSGVIHSAFGEDFRL